jgi:pimeloyl-[acyl-carrier protein] methyl ester esterase
VRLVFVHGWALGPEMWDLLGPLLGDHAQFRVDLGFFGASRLPDFRPGDVLVGHSTGLLWGLKARADWAGAIAINGFSRFALDAAGRGCVKPAALRAMQKSLTLDADACVARFRASIDAPPALAAAQAGPLTEGLALLRDFDAAPALGNSPCLVVAARDDALVPPDEAENLAQASSGRLVLSASGGHGLPWTAAEFCAGLIEDFLRAHEF